MPLSCRRRNNRPGAFTLPEVLITLAILLIILVTVLRFVTEIDTAWKTSAADPFAEAQDAFDTVAQNLATATLEPYQDYADTTGAFRTGPTFTPDHFARRSDLAFVCGPGGGATGLLTPTNHTATGSAVFFVAANGYTQTFARAGLGRLLNATGYFVEFGDDSSAPSFMLSQTHFWRWRLKEFRQPSESLQIFSATTSPAWIQQAVPAGATVPVLAENVIALVVLPERAASDTGAALAPNFSYDSRDTTNRLTLHQLPPRVRLALVAIDSASAQRLATQDGSTPPPLVASSLFQQATQLDADLASLESTLVAQKIKHRIFQREILLPAASWSNTPSP